MEITGEQPLIEQDHPIRRTKFAKDFFVHQSAVEKENGGGGGNFREVFQRNIRDIFAYAKNNGWAEDIFNQATPDELEERTETFFQELKEIEMEDTLYHDIPDALSGLAGKVGGMVLYTTGDPEYQYRKIDKSEVWKKILEAEENSGRNDLFLNEIISANRKESGIPGVIDRFRESKGKDKEICVVIYDDLVSNFTKTEGQIERYEDNNGIKLKRLYVWAKSGRITEEMTPVKEQEQKKGAPEYETIERLSDLEGILNKKEIDPSTALVLLDFDGALSDNRMMKVRQAHIAYTHTMVLIKNLVQKYVGWKKGEKNRPEIREQIRKLYAGISIFWNKEIKKEN